MSRESRRCSGGPAAQTVLADVWTGIDAAAEAIGGEVKAAVAATEETLAMAEDKAGEMRDAMTKDEKLADEAVEALELKRNQLQRVDSRELRQQLNITYEQQQALKDQISTSGLNYDHVYSKLLRRNVGYFFAVVLYTLFTVFRPGASTGDPIRHSWERDASVAHAGADEAANLFNISGAGGSTLYTRSFPLPSPPVPPSPPPPSWPPLQPGAV